MSITEGTQPAAKTWTGAWTSAQTTASFTPETGALLVAILSANTSAGAQGTGNITDSLGGTWTLLKRENILGPSIGGDVEVWVRDSPGTSLTVSATAVSNSGNGGQLAVRTLIGALPVASQNGATAGNVFNSAAIQLSVAAGTGNKIYGGALNWTNSTVMTALGNTTVINAFSDTTNGDTWEAFKSTGDTAGTATYGYSTSTQGQCAAVEIKAAPTAGGVLPFRPGKIWLRRYKHPQQTFPSSVSATPDQFLTPLGIPDLSALGLSTLTPGAVTLSPLGIPDGSALGLAALAQALAPGGIDDRDAVGLSTLTPGAVTLAPGGIGDGSAVGLATLTPGAVTVSPGGIGDGSAVGLTALAQGVAPGGIPDSSAVGLSTLTPGAVSLTPGGIPDKAAVGLTVVAALGAPLNPGSIPDASGVGLTTLTQTLAPAGIPDGSAVGSPSVQLSSLAPGGIRDGSALGLSTVSFTVAPGSIADLARVGLSSLTPGVATISPGGIDDREAVGRSVLALTVSVIDVNGRVVVTQTVSSSVDAGGPSSLVSVTQTNVSSAFAASSASGGVRVDPTEDGRAEVS